MIPEVQRRHHAHQYHLPIADTTQLVVLMSQLAHDSINHHQRRYHYFVVHVSSKMVALVSSILALDT